MKNTNLCNAKASKNDEFFTRIEDVENELKHYEKYFKGKTILLNSNDSPDSGFFQYFEKHYKELGIKKLIAVQHHEDGGWKRTYENWENHDVQRSEPMKGDGSFNSPECIELLKEADIVVTNPPFSIFRQFLSLLVEHNKKFIVLGNMNAVTCREVFPLFMENRVWFGYGFNIPIIFKTPYANDNESNRAYVRQQGFDPDDGYIKTPALAWYTNFEVDKDVAPLTLTESHNAKKYPHYDNYDAINVDKVSEIPYDYAGVMGVPITYLGKHDPSQFELLGHTTGREEFAEEAWPTKHYKNPVQHNPDGTTAGGSKVNSRAEYLIETPAPNETYYTADNASGPLKRCYSRVLIKRRTDQVGKKI